MMDGAVDLKAHRTIAAQRLEVLRRKQLNELEADFRNMKSRQDLLESLLLQAIAESEKRIAEAPRASHGNGGQSESGAALDPPIIGNAANMNWLHGAKQAETSNGRCGQSRGRPFDGPRR